MIDDLRGDLAMDHDPGLTRRRLLSRSVAAVAAAQLVPLEWPEWLSAGAWAASDGLVGDTINGLVAFIVPGRDAYSRAQGVVVDEPGGIGAGATGPVIALLDFFASDAQGRAVPLSGLVVTLLNSAAQRVNPNASRGGFVSPFARLSFAEKLAAYHNMDVDPALASAQGQLAMLPAVVGLDRILGGAGARSGHGSRSRSAGGLADVWLRRLC